MYKITINFIITIWFINIYSQNIQISKGQDVVNQAVFRACLLPGTGGFALETNVLKNNISLQNEIYVDPNLSWKTDIQTMKNKFTFYPTLSYAGAIRYYYNLKKRKTNRKKVYPFSGNYLSIRLVVPLGEKTILSRSGFVIIQSPRLEFLWGIQRCSKNLKWNYGFALGAFRDLDNREYHPQNNKPWFLYPTIYANFGINLYSFSRLRK